MGVARLFHPASVLLAQTDLRGGIGTAGLVILRSDLAGKQPGKLASRLADDLYTLRKIFRRYSSQVKNQQNAA
jgi:hypothetical protein